MISPTDGVSCALCHTDRLHVPLSVSPSPSLSLSPSLPLSLSSPLPLSDTCSMAQAAWRGEDAKGGWEVMAGATYMGAMNITPELFHCGPMSGSRDM